MESVAEVDAVFEALADPTRRRIVELLAEAPHRAGDLTRTLGTSAPTTSRHLRVLLDSGLVTDERPAEDARGRLFRMRPQSLASVVAWADQMQAQWDEQLDAFRRHVERRHAKQLTRAPSAARRKESR